MRITLLTLPVLSTILACGPGAPGDSETEPGTTGTGTASTTDSGTASTDSVSATEPPATTDALPTTGPETSTSGPVETSTSGPVETSTSGPIETSTSGPVETSTSTTVDPSTTTTTSETEGAPDFEFAAQFWAGGLDHLLLRMAAIKDDYCVEIHFARPGGAALPGLTLPTDWWYQSATVSPGVVDCFDFLAPLPPGASADSIAGSAAWATEPVCPPTLDAFELLLEFPQDEPWVPADVQVFGGPVAVEGC